jgi:hypothetical protein
MFRIEKPGVNRRHYVPLKRKGKRKPPLPRKKRLLMKDVARKLVCWPPSPRMASGMSPWWDRFY